jgi:hypothetical protein
MPHALKRHPDSLCLAAAHVEADIARSPAGGLVFCYVVIGRIGELRMPAAAAAARSDELWQHTCFEAFIWTSPGAAYYEFNFAPSAQWAAYRFDSYRSGMCIATGMAAPRIEVQSSADRYTLRASLALDRLPGLSRDATWHLGLSALIEDMSGGKSYWALAHPPGKPDFHHSDCFAHEFSPA